MKLTDHFALDEFTVSQTAARLGLDNTPAADIVANLTRLAQTLEQVRVLLGSKPILISSGYRAPLVNAAVGGVATSDHTTGLAADFICPGYGSPLAICRKIDGSALAFQQLIHEGTWVHLAVAAEGAHAKGQVLTAHFGNGPTRYTPGLS